MQNNIKVGIVDDHTLFRDGLSNLLSEFPFISIVFRAQNGKEMMDKLPGSDSLPEVILMDINMPITDGYDATTWVKKNYPDIGVLALSMYEDDTSIIKMLKCGAGGYILKESNAQELVKAVQGIKSSGYFVNDLVTGKLIHQIQYGHENPETLLTNREIEFLALCCSELTYKELADKMHVSPRTIDGYRDALFEKLSVRSRTGLVLFAIKTGIFKVL